MAEITIRKVEAKDIAEIKAMINEAWSWAALMSNQDTLDATFGLYLNQNLFLSDLLDRKTLNLQGVP